MATSAPTLLFSPDGVTPGDADEGDLVRAALAGEDQGWARLIERHSHRVLVSLLARGVAIERAHELVQETWLRLIEANRAGRLETLALPGLAIVQARFLAANDRRQAPAPERLALAPPQGAPATGEDLAIERQKLDRVAAALERCAPGARRVFEFVYEHPELSYGEVAAHMKLSSQRVKQIVCEVRKQLRAALEEETP
jgi:RNA polymerase sigma factor (sigma-70 family)